MGGSPGLQTSWLELIVRMIHPAFCRMGDDALNHHVSLHEYDCVLNDWSKRAGHQVVLNQTRERKSVEAMGANLGPGFEGCWYLHTYIHICDDVGYKGIEGEQEGDWVSGIKARFITVHAAAVYRPCLRCTTRGGSCRSAQDAMWLDGLLNNSLLTYCTCSLGSKHFARELI